MNRRGIALMLVYSIIVVLTMLSAVSILRSMPEVNILRKYIGSTKAFWAAEAGIAKAAAQLPSTISLEDQPLDSSNNLQYNTTTAAVAGSSNQWDITSTGKYILGSNIEERTVKIRVYTSFGSITNAVETTGDLKITPNVTISPAGSQLADSGLSFQTVFGLTEGQVKALVETHHILTDPSTHQEPLGGMHGITWVDLTGANDKYVLNSNDWGGTGLLIVHGNGEDVALDISGGWTFTGLIWVIGKLSISGTANISGAIFAESDIDVTQAITGTADLTFVESAKNGAFGLIPNNIAVDILSWQEIQS